ncbi:hypothetical protein [Phenylobacterium sp.]|uniref:hypothetical protein n=1 Tax=Phenylobacterium sp. TaxID=1871053 RepID=UPI0030020CBA
MPATTDTAPKTKAQIEALSCGDLISLRYACLNQWANDPKAYNEAVHRMAENEWIARGRPFQGERGGPYTNDAGEVVEPGTAEWAAETAAREAFYREAA